MERIHVDMGYCDTACDFRNKILPEIGGFCARRRLDGVNKLASIDEAVSSAPIADALLQVSGGYADAIGRCIASVSSGGKPITP